MAPPRRASNGRSPLVNQQRQITAFFSKPSSSSPSPVLSKQSPKLHPNPKPDRSPSPSASPTTPLPLQPKRKKPLLVIGPSPDLTADKKRLGEEVLDKRIRVYWPLDQSWYEGCVKSFDKSSGKHLIQYDDAEEELLDLEKEKIEWVEEVSRRFRRLRRVSVVEDEEESAHDAEGGGDDDSADENWNEAEPGEADEDVSGDMDLEGEDDEESDEGRIKLARGKNSNSGKRKSSAEAKPGSNKKSKGVGDAKKGTCKVSPERNGDRLFESSLKITAVSDAP